MQGKKRGLNRSQQQELLAERDAMRERILSLEREKTSARERCEELEADKDLYRGLAEETSRAVLRFSSTVPVVRSMLDLILSSSEKAVIDLTEDIFSVTGNSQEVGSSIASLMERISKGDMSLEGSMDLLLREIGRIEALMDRFHQIQRENIDEMRLLSEMVHGIHGYAGEIADIAERTGILAINASIEAARVGASGKGFAVIAGEVQKLAGRTKKISEEITRNLRQTIDTFNLTFKRQAETIEESVRLMDASRKTMREVSMGMNPQLSLVEKTTEQSRELSSAVTERIARMTEALQFQDKIRQILEHVKALLQMADTACSASAAAGSGDHGVEAERERMRLETVKLASSLFTVQEEWDLFRINVDKAVPSTFSTEGTRRLAGEKLKGDITLF